MLTLSRRVFAQKAAYSVLAKGSQLSAKGAKELSKSRAAPSFRDISTKDSKLSLWDKTFGPESNVASEDFKSRWAMAVPAFATHMCIGSPWAWSLMADVITREVGFVAPVAADWTLMEAAFPLSIVFLMQGVSASLVGKWQMKVGARQAMAASAFCFGGGMALGALGIHFHSLPLLYAGYGFLGGTGIGLTYTPPVQTLMQWFPDKRGIASGLTIAGFGSGALVFTPSVQALMQQFAKMPDYLGAQGQVVTKLVDGKLFAEVDGAFVHVINAGTAELAKLPYDLAEGLYVVGSGSTGAAEALACMGGAYFTIIMSSALTLRRPHASYLPEGMAKPDTSVESAVAVPDVSLEDAMKAPQFYLLGTTFFCLATGGMGMFSVAKPMMSEVFSSALPAVVTSAFAAKFLLMLSAGNLGGRLGWAAVSDAIGRRNTFMLFTAGSIPLYIMLPSMVEGVVTTGSSVPLYTFCASTALAVSFMGGVFAILPAYEADLFGTKFVGAIHGRMLLFSSAAALAGPAMLINLRAMAELAAIKDLCAKVRDMG
jgi:MFS family permease